LLPKRLLNVLTCLKWGTYCFLHSALLSVLRTDKLEKAAECPKKLSDWRTDEKMADTLSLTAELQFPQERRVRNFCSLVQLPMLIHIK
jgi:hypothetical protein